MFKCLFAFPDRLGDYLPECTTKRKRKRKKKRKKKRGGGTNKQKPGAFGFLGGFDFLVNGAVHRGNSGFGSVIVSTRNFYATYKDDDDDDGGGDDDEDDDDDDNNGHFATNP